MGDVFEPLLKNFTPNGISSGEAMSEVEDHFKCSLPQSYRAFMMSRDGGEGFVGDQYLILWKTAELIEFNRDYEAETYAPGLVLFGSNGGGEGFAFDARNQTMNVRMVPFIGMSLEDAMLVSGNFDTFLFSLANPDAALQ